MSVLQRLFHHPSPNEMPSVTLAPPRDRPALRPTLSEPIDDLAGYLDSDTSPAHGPGEPPHWAPECGTPSFSTRHRCAP